MVKSLVEVVVSDDLVTELALDELLPNNDSVKENLVGRKGITAKAMVILKEIDRWSGVAQTI